MMYEVRLSNGRSEQACLNIEAEYDIRRGVRGPEPDAGTQRLRGTKSRAIQKRNKSLMASRQPLFPQVDSSQTYPMLLSADY